jgi:hypothetical protein
VRKRAIGLTQVGSADLAQDAVARSRFRPWPLAYTCGNHTFILNEAALATNRTEPPAPSMQQKDFCESPKNVLDFKTEE